MNYNDILTVNERLKAYCPMKDICGKVSTDTTVVNRASDVPNADELRPPVC